MNINDYIRRKNKGSKPHLTPEEAIEKYSGMSEQELMEELLKTAERGREDGELDNKTLDDIRSKVAPLLTPEQASKLNDLVEGLKN